ncbi:hypothetical protein WOLCODRAFT_147172 [Wolfiporia cocos MD-104 SS10]|uniref:DUF6534 domain-containing protein n=1 Tax=Wolfiporia cocos (strain MD-104) TaxID=742152 RepID=A0A2H3IUG5_WOLCO|nr:hypothetical protein WOLCODRAFT_147172 [Wolfiporia cocos MD-104 SS10]
MSAEAALQDVVRSTMGPLLLGLVFSATFFGITLLQTYQYYDRYWNDTKWLKSFVAVIRSVIAYSIVHAFKTQFILSILDALQLMTVIHANWWYLIQNYGDPDALGMVPWSLGLETGLTSSIGFCVQGFFAMRVWILSHGSRVVTGLIALFTIAQFALGIYYTAREFVSSRISEESNTNMRVIRQRTALAAAIQPIIWASTSALACSIAGDVLITVSMCFFLYRSRSGVAKTDKMIHVLIKYTVNTGLITTIAAVCTITLSEVLPNSYWDTISYFVVSKCYVNSTLATLNAREKLRNQRRWHVESTQSTQPPIFSTFQPAMVNILQNSFADSEFSSMPESHTHVASQSKAKTCSSNLDTIGMAV